MRARSSLFCSFAALLVVSSHSGAAVAEIIVDPPRSITHRVSVQIIQTALSDGSSPATIFGTATQEADIKAGIDQIWAQAGIDIDFLPNVIRYNNTFAYQGNGGPRPQSDLGTIMASAASIMNPTPSVINEFFVNIVPGFDFTSEFSANGLANIGRDGTAQFVGDSLLGSAGNRDVIAGVVAHEIGHVLGLKHAASGAPNLMSPQGTTEQLSAEQISAIFRTTSLNNSVALIPSGGTGFPQPFSTSLAGDYNSDGLVNAADYTVWRNTLGSRTTLAADGNHNQLVDTGDFTIWKTNFGGTQGSGATLSQTVPEPAAALFALLAAVLVLARIRDASQDRRD